MEKSYKPLVSIIIPLYNCSAYIVECLDSLHNQKYSNVEIIVVDDGSTDGSEKSVESYKDVRLIRQSNQGVTAARKAGVAAARGEWIMFVDADDAVGKDILAAWIPYMRHDIDIIIGKMHCDDIVSSQQLLYDIMEIRHFPKAPWLKLFRRSLFEDSYALDIPREIVWGEDLLMLLRLASASRGNVVYSKNHDYLYRVHPSQITKIFRVTSSYEQKFHELFMNSIPRHRFNHRMMEGSLNLRLQYYERMLKDARYTDDDVRNSRWLRTLNEDITSFSYRPSAWYRMILKYGKAENIKQLRSLKWIFRIFNSF